MVLAAVLISVLPAKERGSDEKIEAGCVFSFGLEFGDVEFLFFEAVEDSEGCDHADCCDDWS